MIFTIKKENISQSDQEDTTNTYSIANGEQQSQGFEIDLQGNITSELAIVASYGYTTTKDKDNDNNEFYNIPKNTANIFATYNLSKFDLPNMYIGGGAKFIGSKYVDIANTIEVDSTVNFSKS